MAMELLVNCQIHFWAFKKGGLWIKWMLFLNFSPIVIVSPAITAESLHFNHIIVVVYGGKMIKIVSNTFRPNCVIILFDGSDMFQTGQDKV